MLDPLRLLNVSGGIRKAMHLISHLLGRRLHFSFGPSSPRALVAAVAAPPLLQQRHTGASHRDGDVDLRVWVAASDAGAGSLQDDGRRVDRSAAVLVALLPVKAEQTALTQTVCFRDVTGVPGRVVREPEKGIDELDDLE